MFRMSKSIETESGLVAAWGWGAGECGGWGGGIGKGHRVSFWSDANVLKSC